MEAVLETAPISFQAVVKMFSKYNTERGLKAEWGASKGHSRRMMAHDYCILKNVYSFNMQRSS
jgi:hypothetical protein